MFYIILWYIIPEIRAQISPALLFRRLRLKGKGEMVIWSSMTAAHWQPPGLRFLTEVISNILQTWMEVVRHARYPVAKARETSGRTWATGVRSQAAATGGGTASALKTVAHTSAAFCCDVTAAWLPWNTRDGRSPGGGAHNPSTTCGKKFKWRN